MAKLQRDDETFFDMMPDELLLHVFRGVGCAARSKSDHLGAVCERWRQVRSDPHACTCNVDELIGKVLLDRDRPAMQHIARSHRHRITPEMLGELCLAVGDLGCPAGDSPIRCTPRGDEATKSLLFLACKEGRHKLMRKLLLQGTQPSLSVVIEACRRLHEQDDEGPIQALLDGATDVDEAESILIDSVVLDSEDSSDASLADFMSEILSSTIFSVALKKEKLTTAFIYLLRWEPRFRRFRHNYLFALESAVATGNQLAARDLFEQCHMKAKWLTRSHVVLLAQKNWSGLLRLALTHHPNLAREALEWAIICKSADSVAVAASLYTFDGFHAVSVLQLIEREGDDRCCSLLVKSSPSFVSVVAPDVFLQLAWRKRWLKTLRRALRIAAAAREPARFLVQNMDNLILWALANNEPKIVAYALSEKRVNILAETACSIARHVRTYETQTISHSLNALLKERAGVFR